MHLDLTSSTIGAIREFIDSQTSRDELKALALRAGPNAHRVMKINVSSNMRDTNYKSKATLRTLARITLPRAERAIP